MRLFLVLMLLFFSSCTPETVSIACTLRNDGQGWYAIDDAGHAPIGITGVETTNDGKILVRYACMKKIGTFIVTPDETFSRAGITAGASVGLEQAVITVSILSDGRFRPIDARRLVSSSGNLWVYGVMEK